MYKITIVKPQLWFVQFIYGLCSKLSLLLGPILPIGLTAAYGAAARTFWTNSLTAPTSRPLPSIYLGPLSSTWLATDFQRRRRESNCRLLAADT